MQNQGIPLHTGLLRVKYREELNRCDYIDSFANKYKILTQTLI